METRFLTLPDRRKLAFCEYGDPDGFPVFYAHGGPGSRLEGGIFHATAARFGFRLIALDRPGMGRSDFHAGRTLLDYPRDLAALADALGIARFGSIGWSSGGAHTTVCSHSLMQRLAFNISLAGYTNFAELPGAAGMLKAPADRLSVSLSRHTPRIFQSMFSLMHFFINRFPESYYTELLRTVNDSDHQVCRDPKFKAHFLADQKEAFAQGSQGVTLDAAIHYLDWGICLKDITGKFHLFHGTQDNLVPIEYARHIAAHAPGCVLHELEGMGHLFPVDHQDLIFQTARAEI